MVRLLRERIDESTPSLHRKDVVGDNGPEKQRAKAVDIYNFVFGSKPTQRIATAMDRILQELYQEHSTHYESSVGGSSDRDLFAEKTEDEICRAERRIDAAQRVFGYENGFLDPANASHVGCYRSMYRSQQQNPSTRR